MAVVFGWEVSGLEVSKLEVKKEWVVERLRDGGVRPW